MSLETLLEAAKYLEYRTEAKARGEEPQDYTTYSRLFANGGSTPSVSQENNGDSSPNHIDEFKDRRRASGAGTREVHNKLEKNRRAHLKECFETLKRQIPNMDDKKTSNLSILRSALRYIQALKRKERDYEHEMERLAREKIASQQRLASLKKELSSQLDNVDVNTLIPEADNDTNSTSTASECGPLSDIEEEEKVEVPQVISAQSSMNTSTVITTASVLTNLSKVTASSLPSDVKPPVSSSTVIQHHVHLTQPVTTTQCGHSMVTLATAASTAVPRPIVSFTPTITAKSSSLQMASMSQSVHQSPVQAQPTAATIQVPQPTLQTIAVSKAATAIAMNALTSQVSATHLQIPAQMVSHTGIQMNGGPSVIAHPAVQVIAQPGVRVISAAPNTTLGTLSSQVATTGNITSSSTSSINMMAQKTAVVTAVTATQSVAKTAIVPSVTLTKQNLLPVSVTTMVAQNGPPMAQSKGLVASGTNPGTTTIPVTVAQLAVKATGSGVSTLSIPTSITALPRSVALQTSSTPTQGIVSLTGVNGALSSTATMQLPNVCKPTAQLLQPTLTQRTVTQHPVYSQNNQGSAITTHSVNNLTRHLMTAAVKPMAPVRTPITQITHVVQPTPIASVGQLVSSGNHMSAVTPLVAPMSVVNHAAVAQVLAQPQLGKVTVASPLLKSVGQIPLMQQQFLQPAQPLVKPVVVVTAPSIVTSSVANTPQASPQTVQVSLPGSH